MALPFVDDPDMVWLGGKPLGRKYPATSIGWYRKVFDVPEGPGKRFHLEFDGVFRNAIVVFNNFYIGRNLSGYAPFSYDVTDFTNQGGKNTLCCASMPPSMRAGFTKAQAFTAIVWLTVKNPVHVPQWGTYVRTEVQGDSATVSITAEIQNDSDTEQKCEVASWVDLPSGSGVIPRTVIVPPWGRV